MKNIALVTGAGSELGREVVGELLTQGWGVVAACKDGDGVPMGREGVLTVTLDISRHATVVEAVAKGLSEFGRIDCLINIPEIDEDLLERGDFTRGIQAVFQTGIASGLNATLALVPLFRHQGFGAVVQVIVQQHGPPGPLSSAWEVVRCVGERMVDLVKSAPRGLNVAVGLAELDWNDSWARRVAQPFNFSQQPTPHPRREAVGNIVTEACRALTEARAAFRRGSALTPAQYRWLESWKNAATSAV